MVKQVIVVRKDLNMRKGKIAAQVAHASMASLPLEKAHSGFFCYIKFGTPYAKWLEGPFTKIVVSCDSESELFSIIHEAEKLGVQTRLITDRGLTEFHHIATNTCLSVGPDEEEKIDQLTGHLKLL